MYLVHTCQLSRYLGILPIWRLVSRPPDSYLKSPDIKVGSRPTADRTAFAGDRLVPGSDTRCLCLQIVPATPSERAGNQLFWYTFKMASRGEKRGDGDKSETKNLLVN